jgi:tetratricopeptide (TPR) repeat protein
MLPFVCALLFWFGAADAAHRDGVELYKQHKYNEAIAALEQSSKAEAPDSAEYRESMLMIGQSYFMLSQAPKAIPWLEKAPSTNERNYMLGYARLQAGDEAGSVRAFAELFGVNPESAAAHLLTGQMLIKKEFTERAVDEVNRALAIDPKIPQAHFLLAEMAIFRGRLDEGIGELRKELAVDPNYYMAWYRLGDAYARQEHWDLAIPNLQRAIWLNQNFSGPFILLGKCYFKTGDYSNAEKFLRSALALDPRNYSATYLLGRTLFAMGRTDEAKTMMERSRTLQQ